ncbi:MAG: hypothetical protein ACOVLB_05410 [Candidatus Nanopelagicus sp.]
MSLNLTVKIVSTTPYNIVNSDDVILVNVTSGPASIVLPATGVDGTERRSFYIKDYSGTSLKNPITITSSGNKTINGVAFAMLNGNYSHIQVVYDGTNWMTIA